ncbi:hypothetical protein [Microbacterium sp. NPDC058389]|uniref:hypothetical protein n=1 Tax=Microbacterium sp. NPDC058389 TaxID=3346475 RepID=UPI00365E8CEE
MTGRIGMPRLVVGAAALLLIAAVTTGCRPEGGTPTQTPSSSPSITVKDPTPGPSVTPFETDEPQAGFEMPTTCETIYSAAMLASLESANPPLNDPGVTMLSTENADLLEVIHSGAPTLRCSWGKPSEYGLATNVTAIEPQQSATLVSALGAAGFGCEPMGDGTVCRIEQKGVTLDDNEYTRGETHYIADDAVITTAWINFAPEGYTEDIVATLWG